MNKIAVIGSINMDISICSDVFPKIGETIRGYDFTTQPGGKGANQAITIGNLGGAVSFLGCIGSDSNGQLLSHTLQSHHVDISHMETIADTTSGTAMIFVCNGDNSIIINGGANFHVNDTFIQRHTAIIAESKILLSQLEIPIASVITAFRIAKHHGVTTILNPAPIQTLPDELLQLTDIIILNETEAEFLIGHSVHNVDEAAVGIRALQQMGIAKVIITLGSHGCVYSTTDQTIKQEPARKVTVVDTTGAGDTFCGAFSYGMANNLTLEEAIKLATLCSSVTVTRRGAAFSIPTKSEINEILKKEGNAYELS